MASDPFLCFVIDPGSSSAGVAAKDPISLFTQQNVVLYAPPLRIVAPPGVQPFLPPSFDPRILINGHHPADLFSQGSAVNFSGVDQARPGIGVNDGLRSFTPADSQNHTNKDPRSKHNVKDHGKHKSTKKAGSFRPGRSTVKATGSSFGYPSNGAQESPRASTGTTLHANKQILSASSGPNEKRITPDSEKKSPLNSVKPFLAEGVALEAKKRIWECKPKHSAKKRPSTEGHSILHAFPQRAVTDTLRISDALRRNIMHEEELKGKEANKGARPDLTAGSIINSNGLAVNRSQKVVGSVPGIEVGALFYFRMEMSSVGLHGPIQPGIEYLTAKESEFETPVAISIISSGGYDAKDDGEELVYTGQGGKSADDSKQREDQKLERGNLAMKGSMEHKVPVRVTRGIKDSASPSGKTYTYDGLYMVEESWSEKGKFGFEEFKFKLRRCPGQPELGSGLLKLSNVLRYKPNQREGLCLKDVSNGKEGLPVCVVNSIDGPSIPPSLEYSTTVHYSLETSFSEQFGRAEGCACEGSCTSSQTCSCCVANGGSFAYLSDGILVQERGLIYECGSNCKCSFGCKNRLTQRALKYRLEIFKTSDRGWGLRSWDTIPAGGFICEYVGNVVQDPQTLTTRDFVLDLSRVPKNIPAWGDVSKLLDRHSVKAISNAPRPDLIVDSSQMGNAARFINHSCSPNVLVQCVLRDYQDTKQPHVMLFAMDNIPPFRELTIDYGSHPPSLNYEVFERECLCKSVECKGTFYQ